jgi:hypothetical protein
MPTFGSSLRLSARAFRREVWLAALGLLVTGARRATGWPAIWTAAVLLWRAAQGEAAARPLVLAAPVEGALAMLASGRFLGIVGGLWLAGALVAGALRVAWVTGAVQTLCASMAGAPRGAAGFAASVGEGFARVLPAALLGFALELSGALFAGTMVLASVLLVAHPGEVAALPAVALAAITALALVLAMIVPLGLSTAADALMARAALVREGPAAALAAVTRRFLARPGAFLLGALLFGLAGVVVQLSVQALGTLATGFAAGAPAAALLGPRLMVGALAALLAGALDLLWLGTLAVLTSGEARRGGAEG